jgi:hypothetical protein
MLVLFPWKAKSEMDFARDFLGEGLRLNVHEEKERGRGIGLSRASDCDADLKKKSQLT